MSAIYSRVRENSKVFPDKQAIISGDIHLTYSQLLDQVENRFRQLMRRIPFSRSRVGLCLHEGINVPITILALNALRVPIIPLDPRLQGEQIQHLLDAVNADVVITEKTTSNLVVGSNKRIKSIDLSELNEVNQSEQEKIPSSEGLGEYEEFLITLSSGSTGNPKPIVLSEKNKLDRSNQAVLLYKVSCDDVILCASPFFHTLGQRLTLLPLIVGATLVQLTRFTVENWSKAIEENGVTFTIPVSSHLHELVEPLLTSKERFRTLRCLVSSSAYIDHEVKEKLFKGLPCDFHEMYGASEIATATDLNSEQVVSKPKSVGIACPNVEIRIVDKELVECKPMEVGQIIIKSPLASSGYYKLPKITAESFVDGYFHTGDLGYLDKESFLYFVDREKDVIISGGMNIYPSDIENVLKKHSKVYECATIGIHDPYLGEVPVIVVVCYEDVQIVERELRSIAKQKLAASQRPLMYFFRDQLPLTSSGKVDKRSLREELNELKLDLSSKLRALQNSYGQL